MNQTGIEPEAYITLYNEREALRAELEALRKDREALTHALDEIESVIGHQYQPGERRTMKHGYIGAIIYKARKAISDAMKGGEG